MKFQLGHLPESSEFAPDGDWTLLQEPSTWGFQIGAIPIAIAVTVLLTVLWLGLTPLWQTVKAATFPLPISLFAVCLIGVLIAHELIHVLIQPRFGSSDKTVLGFWPSRMFLYTLYVGELSKKRCMAILVAPFILISIVPLIYATFAEVGHLWLAYTSIVNGLLASGDILAAIITARLIPVRAIIRTKGWSTYWRASK